MKSENSTEKKVLEAIKQSSYDFECILDDIRREKEVVIEAVRSQGYALQDKLKKTKTKQKELKMTQKQFNKNEIKKKFKMDACCDSIENNFKLGFEIAGSSMEELRELANTTENEEEAVHNLIDLLAGFFTASMVYISTLKNKKDSKMLVALAAHVFNKALDEQ